MCAMKKIKMILDEEELPKYQELVDLLSQYYIGFSKLGFTEGTEEKK